MRPVFSLLLMAVLVAAAACKRSDNAPQAAPKATPDANLKAAAERQREAIQKTAEALRKQQQQKQQSQPSPTASP